MDNFSKISQLTALCSWRRAKINKGSSWSDGNLNLLNVLKIIFHSLSTWWQLSYSQLLWHHTGDGKLIIGVLWNSYLSTCVDLCSYAFDPPLVDLCLAQANSDQSSLLCRSDSFRKEEMQHKPKLDHVWLGNLWWWFVIKLYDCLLNSLKKLKPLLNIFT